MDEKVETLQAELQHIKEENNILRLMLEVQSSKYKNLQSYLQEINNSNKRARLDEFPTAKKPLQVFVRTHSKDDSLILKDGYQWRKYGQKVTKNNASPRAYFRCSMAPSCPAKKKVQRCIHDRSILVATYDGEHNHGAIHESLIPFSSTPKGSQRDHGNNIKIEEYVNSLIKDPDFTVALAEAVARSIIDQPKQQGLNLNLGLPEE